jgi:hypothetical protein
MAEVSGESASKGKNPSGYFRINPFSPLFEKGNCEKIGELRKQIVMPPIPSKRTAFESFGNPAILEDEGWRSFFTHLHGDEG